MENWEPISEQYAVSDMGRLYSWPRWGGVSGRGGTHGGYMKLTNLDKDGYVKIGLRMKGQRKWYRFHQLVCEAFHGPRPEGCVVDHRNGDKVDNRATNLWWVSLAENCAKDQFGEASPRAKLTEKQVRKIRGDSRSYRALAEVYSVHPMTVRDVKKRISWRHLV